MATPHIELNDLSLIAKTVLMPGDPLRAKYIAEMYLTDIIKINSVRNMFGYTGKYKGKRITIMGSGMGMPSIGIYSYELFKFYNVDRIIRIGSCGSYTKKLNLYDCFLGIDSYSESSFAKILGVTDKDIIAGNSSLNKEIISVASKLGIVLHQGRMHSSDVFYRKDNLEYKKIREEKKCQVVEMESFALFANAILLNKEAACILTISDNLETKESTDSTEREKAFTKMMEIALNLAKED